MSFKDYFQYIRNLIQSIPFNIFDYVIFITLFLYVFEDISLLYKNVFNEQGVQIFEATNKGLYGYVFIKELHNGKVNYKEEFEHRKEICQEERSYLIREGIDYDNCFAYFSWRKKYG